MAMRIRKDLVSEAAQTILRENEAQTLEWDVTEEPTPHPSKFPRGQGLRYPVLYDPTWPLGISKTRKEKPARVRNASVVGSWALTGVTNSEEALKPIKKALIFPHRNVELPFRQPVPHVVREPTFEPCETLTLKAVEELEAVVEYKSLLERMPKYIKNDPKARAVALRLLLRLPNRGHATEEQEPPARRRRRTPQWRRPPLLEEKGDEEISVEKMFEIISGEGMYCQVHGCMQPDQGSDEDSDDELVCDIHGTIPAVRGGERDMFCGIHGPITKPPSKDPVKASPTKSTNPATEGGAGEDKEPDCQVHSPVVQEK